MELNENLKLRSSKEWFQFCHHEYLSLREIQASLNHDPDSNEWKDFKRLFLEARKLESILFPVKNMGQNYFLFQSDSLYEKFTILERKGRKLYRDIQKISHLEDDLIRNCNEEEAVTSAIFEGAHYSRSEGRRMISLLENKAHNREDEKLLKLYRILRNIPDYRLREFDIDLVSEIYNDLTGNSDPHLLFTSSLAKQRLEEVIELINNHPRKISSVIKGAILHFFIMNIIPFRERNSEMARIIFYFIVSDRKSVFLKFLSVSASLYTYTKSYRKSIEEASDSENDLTFIVEFFLNALGWAIGNVQKKVDDVKMVQKIGSTLSLSESQSLCLQKLLLNKHRGYGYESYGDDFSVGPLEAKNELDDLEKRKYLISKENKKSKIFYINTKKLKSR